MSMKNKLSKIITLVTTFAVGITLAINHNVAPTRVEATQHNSNYGTYTYSGNYYDSINFDAAGGLNGALRQSLTTLIKPLAFYKYSGTGSGTLAEQLQSADEDPTNSSKMVYLYTRDSVTKNAASSWNREHVWCKSLSNGNWQVSGGNGEKIAGTDLLHLRPTYQSPNSTRGNHPYGNTDHSEPKTYSGMTYGYLGDGYFEPLDCVKGDVARIIMYVYTTYINYPNYNPIYITDIFQSYDTLLQWHTMDKPDALEGNRNDYVQTTNQKNRNPFVDHPELGWKIFGDEASTSVKNACMAAYPASGSSVEPTGITLNKSSASISVGRTLQLNATLQPNGATGTVTWSSNNTSAASVSSSGLVTANAVGSATITASVAGYSATCAITVTQPVINYGTETNPLTVSEAIDLIDGRDDPTVATTEPIYVKGIVSSNTAYSTQYKNYDHIYLQSEDGETPQAFDICRAKVDTTKVTGDYTAVDSFKDQEIVAYGYAKKYNSTFEMWTSTTEPKNPLIIKVAPPEATAITLNTTTAEIEVGDTVTLTATLTPSNSESTYTWESSDESVATVENGIVTGVSAGTAIISAIVTDGVEAECTVTVTDGSDPVLIQVASSISASDTVYLTANAVSRQYNGPSSGNADAYGTHTGFNGSEPNTDGLALEVCNGSETNTYAFKLKSGSYANKYLAWSSGNSLKVATSIDDNSSWTVSFDASNNATIANVADSSRVIWWNVGSPRFSCYTGKSDGASYKYTQLWKTVAQIEPTPYDYIDKSVSFANISGNSTTTDNGSGTDSVTFSSAGLSNESLITNIPIGSVTLNGAGGGNSNVPRYYTKGSAIRVYPNNTLTFSSTSPITRIEFTFSQGDSSNMSASTGTLSDDVWTGQSLTVVFTNTMESGQFRLSGVSVTYGQSVTTVSNVAMRFGASISIENWTTIDETWGVDDFGVICVKKTTMDTYKTTYGINTVKDAFLQGKNVTKLGNKNNLEHPYPIGDNYVFTVRIGVSSSNYYNMEVCAVPYIYAGNQYYFFDEIEPYSVKTLAQYYLDNSNLECALPNSALGVLAK